MAGQHIVRRQGRLRQQIEALDAPAGARRPARQFIERPRTGRRARRDDNRRAAGERQSLFETGRHQRFVTRFAAQDAVATALAALFQGTGEPCQQIRHHRRIAFPTAFQHI
jgi:hypothetical protein